jgi:hypothetical protein
MVSLVGQERVYDKKGGDRILFGLLGWFLSKDVDDNKRGKFIAMLRDDTLAADHCLGIDTQRPKESIIFDPSREHALPMVRSSFDLFVPDGYSCVGVTTARKLLPKPSDVADLSSGFGAISGERPTRVVGVGA